MDESSSRLRFPVGLAKGWDIRIVVEGNYPQSENNKRFEIEFVIPAGGSTPEERIGQYVAHEPNNGRADRTFPTWVAITRSSSFGTLIEEGLKFYAHNSDVYEMENPAGSGNPGRMTILIQ